MLRNRSSVLLNPGSASRRHPRLHHGLRRPALPKQPLQPHLLPRTASRRHSKPRILARFLLFPFSMDSVLLEPSNAPPSTSRRMRIQYIDDYCRRTERVIKPLRTFRSTNWRSFTG